MPPLRAPAFFWAVEERLSALESRKTRFEAGGPRVRSGQSDVTDTTGENAIPSPPAGAEPDRRDIVVIGASAGGIQALNAIVPRLPEDLPAAVFVVMHLAPTARSSLAAIIGRQTLLRTSAASDGDRIERGRIYVAPPDRHMVVEDDHIRLSRGPRENGHRPAIDPLFRTAARHFGPRVIGIVLSGNLSDGTVGLKAIDDHGGVTVAQHPGDALHPGMPGSAVDEVDPHHVLPASEIAELVVRLSTEPAPLPVTPSGPPDLSARAELANMSCPECGGPLSELRRGRTPFFVCRVGHSFSTESLFAEQADSLESALWTAIRVLEERRDLAVRLAERLEARGADLAAERFRHNAEETGRQVDAIRRVVEDFDAAADAGPRGADVASAAGRRSVVRRAVTRR